MTTTNRLSDYCRNSRNYTLHVYRKTASKTASSLLIYIIIKYNSSALVSDTCLKRRTIRDPSQFAERLLGNLYVWLGAWSSFCCYKLFLELVSKWMSDVCTKILRLTSSFVLSHLLTFKSSGLQMSMHPWKVWIRNLKKRETLPDYQRSARKNAIFRYRTPTYRKLLLPPHVKNDYKNNWCSKWKLGHPQ